MKPFIFISFLTFTLLSNANEKVSPWNLSELFKAPKWEKADKAAKAGMTGLLYSSIPLKKGTN